MGYWLFCQEKRGEDWLTFPGGSTKSDAWNFAMSETGQVFETYMKEDFICDGTSYSFYLTDTNEYVGGLTTSWLEDLPFDDGIKILGIREFKEKHIFLKRLPFIMINKAGNSSEVIMPESGEYMLDMIIHRFCKRILYIAGYKDFRECTYELDKSVGSISLSILLGSKNLYDIQMHWESSERTFSQYNERIQNPHGYVDRESLEIALDELELSVHTYNNLMRANIRTVAMLVEKTASEIKNLPRIGEEGFQEINDKLEDFGLSFRPENKHLLEEK